VEKEQQSLFEIPDDSVNHWEKEWQGMPEYNNVKQPEAVITATFKFRNQEDYDRFHEAVKKALYGGEKVFDGMQRIDKKVAWYPLMEKASKYRWE